ncbi:hypothetical protein [Chitinophaga sp. XS-30]|uniref:hypothetical protein n=1 Tax=Chitinophaga sp. XS-30 TaxID=2604421 RepID=UPI0011DD96D6|nr:hypothetical protein [Chitinophaga sp. XS-30]QEH39456.1 hypothetical protein FW415_00635 [Chitinophaga sp. XS-30]
MKIFRINHLILISILATGFAFATKAGDIGKKQITDCFATMTVTNGMGSSVPLNGLGCTAATIQASVNQFVQSASNVIDPIDECVGNPEIFCCATVMETADMRAPLIDLGDGLKRYAVDEVFCKIFLLHS